MEQYFELSAYLALFLLGCYGIYFGWRFIAKSAAKTALHAWMEDNYLGVARAAYRHDDSYDPWPSMLRTVKNHVVLLQFKIDDKLLGERYDSIGFHVGMSLDELPRITRNAIISELIKQTPARFKEKSFTGLNPKQLASVQYSSADLLNVADEKEKRRGYKIPKDVLQTYRVEYDFRSAA